MMMMTFAHRKIIKVKETLIKRKKSLEKCYEKSERERDGKIKKREREGKRGIRRRKNA